MYQFNYTHNLFLDDERTPLDVFIYTNNNIYLMDNWTIVRNYGQFVSYLLKYGLPSVISFDHDLADIHYKKCINVEIINYEEFEEKTGYDCAKWLVNYCMNLGNITLPTYFIHSTNVVGGNNISKLLDNYMKLHYGSQDND